MIEVKSVQHRFESSQILDDVTFSLGQGELALLVGANGAGKSTLLKIIAGLISPEKGEVKLAGTKEHPVGYLGHEAMLYGGLTIRENLELFAGFVVGPKEERPLADVIDKWGLSDYQDYTINKLSKGLRARAALARTFLCTSSIVLLDEPTSALDDYSIGLLVDALRSKNEATCLIATHDIARLKGVANRALLLQEGKIKLDSATINANSDFITSVNRVVEFYQSINR